VIFILNLNHAAQGSLDMLWSLVINPCASWNYK